MIDRILMFVAKGLTVLERIIYIVLVPDLRILFVWYFVGVFIAVLLGAYAFLVWCIGSWTVLFVLMLAVGVLVPPPRPLCEASALAARGVDLIRVACGATMFGAAAAYGGIVGIQLEEMEPTERFSLEVMMGIIWPIVAMATAIGASVVGVGLGWDLRRTSKRDVYVAAGRLRKWIFGAKLQRSALAEWFSAALVNSVRSGFFMIIGYLTPVLAMFYMWLIFEKLLPAVPRV